MNVSGFDAGNNGSIRMKRLLALFWILTCMLSLVACDKATGSEEPVTAKEKESINVILAHYITLGLE